MRLVKKYGKLSDPLNTAIQPLPLKSTIVTSVINTSVIST